MSNQDLMQPSSALALFETTKAQREQFATLIIEEIKEGSVDPLKIHMQVKSAEHLLETVKNSPEYKALVLDATEKSGKKFDSYNAEFQVKEAATKWDYSNCDDVKLYYLQRQVDHYTQLLKERQKFLQTIPEGGMVDPDDGNMIYRASKSSTTIVQVTLK